MTPKQYLDAFGPQHVETVCIRAGTTLGYFRGIAYGQRRPSYALAEKLRAESDGKLDIHEMMKTKIVAHVSRAKAASKKKTVTRSAK